MTQSERRYTAGEVVALLRAHNDAVAAFANDAIGVMKEQLEQNSCDGVAELADAGNTPASSRCTRNEALAGSSPAPSQEPIIDVGEGYERLAVGTVILDGDEYRDHCGMWNPTGDAQKGGFRVSDLLVYRRKLPVKGGQSEYESPVSWDELSRLKTLAGLAVELAGAVESANDSNDDVPGFGVEARWEAVDSLIARIEAAAKESK